MKLKCVWARGPRRREPNTAALPGREGGREREEGREGGERESFN